MTLSSLLLRLEEHLQQSAEFGVVAFGRANTDDPPCHNVVAVWPLDAGEEIIVQIAGDDQQSVDPPLSLSEFATMLRSVSEGREEWEVECSESGPGPGWRIDFPIRTTGANAHDRLFALVW
ncbi:MAG: hypothetical protein IT430_04895 [Phycisphaerales bacterium]|nr:hypothetical protein [Phycisphaerales bacterium]